VEGSGVFESRVPVCIVRAIYVHEGEGGHMHMKKGRVLKWRSVNRGERMWASTCVDDLETGGGTCEKPGYI
jgi:hypothetical protein